MSRMIRVKPETYRRLQAWALPLQDSANDALERVLDAADAHREAEAEREKGDE